VFSFRGIVRHDSLFDVEPVFIFAVLTTSPYDFPDPLKLPNLFEISHRSWIPSSHST
jgi:hypothetical protein